MLNDSLIKSQLIYDGNVYVLDSVDSTNNYAKENGGIFGDIFITENQTMGKGRLGRSWFCDNALAMSVCVKPCIAPEKNMLIPLLAGYAVCKVINSYADLDCKIKWPNDVVCGGKKLCGILNEGVLEDGKIKMIVCGIGINTDSEYFSPDIKDKATSVYLQSGTKCDKNYIAAKVANYLYKLCVINPVLPHDFKDMCVNIGKRVTVTENKDIYECTAVDIDESGGLKVKLDSGKIKTIASGEVSVRGIYGYV